MMSALYRCNKQYTKSFLDPLFKSQRQIQKKGDKPVKRLAKQTMVESIMTKSFVKIIIAAVCAILLAIITILVTDIAWWMVLIMLLLVLASFANTYIELKKSFVNGEVLVVYGNCVSVERAVNFVGKPQRKLFSYRFVSLAEEEVYEDREDSVASFYIKGEKGKFTEGESYCFLFKKNKNLDVFNEKNLVGYEITKTFPVAISTLEINEGERNEIASERENTNEEKGVLSNIMYFPRKQHGKGGEE